MIDFAAGRTRALVRAISSANDLRWRQVPKFAIGPKQTHAPTLYYLAPHLSSASGGVRNIYRHVDHLTSAGFNATVVHVKAGFRATWFDNETPIMHSEQVSVEPDDILVIPEVYGPSFGELPTDRRVIVNNQAAYATFDRIEFESTVAGAPYSSIQQLTAILTASVDNADLIRFTFPDSHVGLVRPVIDSRVFPLGYKPRPLRIGYTTTRRRNDLDMMPHVLRAVGLLDRWELVPISGQTDVSTAEIMRSCPIFISFSDREGFGLPPAEAMASGCYVVGYPGLAGREFFDEKYSSPVVDGDVHGLVRAIYSACRAYEANPDNLLRLGQLASDEVLTRYAPERQRDDLIDFYTPILGAGRM